MNRAIACLLALLLFCAPPSNRQADAALARFDALATSPGGGQFEFIAGVVLGGLASGLIGKFEELADRVMANAENTGNALMSKLGNQLKVATRDVDYALGEQRTKAFEQLSVAQQGLFIELNKIVDSINRASGRASTIAELASLDLIEFTNRIRLITKKIDFMVSSISGTTFYLQKNDYVMTVRGIGFGYDDSSAKYQVSVSVDGMPIAVTKMARENIHEIQVYVPANLFQGRFQQSKLVQVPATLTSTIVRGRRARTYSVSFGITLLPIVAGDVTVTEPITTSSLGENVTERSISHTTKGCSSDRPCAWSDELAVAADERIVGVRYECFGQCGWNYSTRRREVLAREKTARPECEREAGPRPTRDVGIVRLSPEYWDRRVAQCVASKVANVDYLPDYDILDDKKIVKVYRTSTGSEVTTTIYYVQIRTLEKSTRDKTSTMSTRFGVPFDVDFDVDNQGCEFVMTGQSSTGQRLEARSSVPHVPGSPLQKIGVGKFGDRCRGTFIVNPEAK